MEESSSSYGKLKQQKDTEVIREKLEFHAVHNGFLNAWLSIKPKKVCWQKF